MTTIKIAVIGPKTAGKTRVSNALAHEIGSPNYDPTVGVRILELQRFVPRPRDGTAASVAIELWDCSGDTAYESCWPAILQGLHGVIVVYDPESKAQTGEVKTWCEWFVQRGELETGQAVVFSLGYTQEHAQKKRKMMTVKAETGDVSIPVVPVTLMDEAAQGDDEPNALLQQSFEKFMSGVLPFFEKDLAM